MASAKLATLIIRTLAKPISSQIKEQARQHERFREMCVNLAQFMYRSEVKLRTNILGEPARHIRPLSESRAIENGSNALAEGFLFAVAASLIIGETWRSSRNQSKRRDAIDDQIDSLGTRLTELNSKVDTLAERWEEELSQERQRNDELSRILERIVEIGLLGGWVELQDTPLQLSGIQIPPLRHPSDKIVEDPKSPTVTSTLPPKDTPIAVINNTPHSDSDLEKPQPT